jgi:hypothetical protein
MCDGIKVIYIPGGAQLEGDEGGLGKRTSGGVRDHERHLHHSGLSLGVPHTGEMRTTFFNTKIVERDICSSILFRNPYNFYTSAVPQRADHGPCSISGGRPPRN